MFNGFTHKPPLQPVTFIRSSSQSPANYFLVFCSVYGCQTTILEGLGYLRHILFTNFKPSIPQGEPINPKRNKTEFTKMCKGKHIFLKQKIIGPTICTVCLCCCYLCLSGKGAASDAQIYNASELKHCIDDGSIGFPPAEPLPNDNEDVPYFLIGDDPFALRSSMMKPYSHRGMVDEERIFNYRLSRARRVVENVFGILANRFQVLLTTMNHAPATVRLIITTCMCLHNLMRMRYQHQ